MRETIYLLFEFGYALVFGFLAFVTLYLHIPKESGIESYKAARKIYGCGLLAMFIFCIFRLFTTEYHGDYEDFWLLVTVSLILSWSVYGSILFLLESPRYLRKSFIIDGVVPITLMVISGIIGIFIPSIQKTMMIIFGSIFGIKCLWMFYTCLREYIKCKEELDNYYDLSPDIEWIRNIIFLSLFLSIATIVSFYVVSIHLIYYLMLPFVLTFITMKIINFMPKKINNIREKNESLMTKPVQEEKKEEKTKDIADKIRPMVEEWVEAKGFCNPELSIKDVATEIGTNQNYLSVYLNKHLNVTFQVWLNTLRIEESKNLLSLPEKMSIEEIGSKVGFTQNYNFSRWFRIVTDMTPYQYRRLKLNRK